MSLQRQKGARRPVVYAAAKQPFAEPEQAAPLIRRKERGKLADSASARALAKLPRKSRFVPRKIACDKRFETHNRRRLEWLRRRRRELHELTGGVSLSVGAMLNAAAWLYAAGDFASERGAETGEVEWFKSAATLTATARTHDIGAWEIATREGQQRRLAETQTRAPWLVRANESANEDEQTEDEEHHGTESGKPQEPQEGTPTVDAPNRPEPDADN